MKPYLNDAIPEGHAFKFEFTELRDGSTIMFVHIPDDPITEEDLEALKLWEATLDPEVTILVIGERERAKAIAALIPSDNREVSYPK